MRRRIRDEDDAYVERLARKLETVPPRRDPSGIYRRRAKPAQPGDPDTDEMSALDEPFPRSAREIG